MSVRNFTLAILAAGCALLLSFPARAAIQSRTFPLESPAGLTLHNVSAEPATLAGQKGVRVTSRAGAQGPADQLARINGLEFSNGVIEVEMAGAPAPNAPQGARGFVGIAFRLQPDNLTYDAFYIRPTNGRAEDQERRNHATQYISHPMWTWSKLRQETPSRYESYVDLVPGEWTKIKIDVRGAAARLFVHDNPQPALIVNDVKTGANASGAVALWVDVGTVAHFRDLRVSTP
jgi:hypothetical protein